MFEPKKLPITPDEITFEIKAELARYGLKGEHKWGEYRILMMQDGVVVGFEEGPRRTFKDRAAALAHARARVKVLKSHRLFVIPVTRKNLLDGDARSCRTCAIAQALWDNQERMGFEKGWFRFDVEPYAGMFGEARGIVVSKRYFGDDAQVLADLPALVTQPRRKYAKVSPRYFHDDMAEWTMNWDSWKEMREEGGLRAWRKNHGHSIEERPYEPSPCTFVLDLDAFTPEEEARAAA